MIELSITKYPSTKYLIDDEDMHFVEGRTTNLISGNAGSKPYVVVVIGRRTVGLHRLIMGEPKGFDIDHKDGDHLNNMKNNLRICTRSQNMANVKKKPGSSRYKGVYWNGINKKWMARITKNYKRYNLGSFDTQEEAAIAYNNAAIEHFGEFALINELPDDRRGEGASTR